MEWRAIACGLHSLRSCEALCHRVRTMLLAVLRGLCSLQPCVDYAPCGVAFVWLLWALPIVGLGLTAYYISRLRSAYLPAVSGSVCFPRTLLGARIVETVHLSLSQSFDGRCRHVSSSYPSRFLLRVLEYYQINFSQLSVLGAAKVSHFEIMCRVLGYRPSLGTFRKFYVSFISNGWLSFSRRGPTPCCLSKKIDSLKN
ncbi:hypothetical protein Tco_0488312 [Tanacetum coccineum]